MEQSFLEIKRGDFKTYTLNFVDDEEAVIDITNWIVFFTVKEKITDDDASAKISKTIINHIDPQNGKTQIVLLDTDTDLIGNYIFDIQIKKGSGEIRTITEGIITFTKDVTIRTS